MSDTHNRREFLKNNGGLAYAQNEKQYERCLAFLKSYYEVLEVSDCGYTPGFYKFYIECETLFIRPIESYKADDGTYWLSKADRDLYTFCKRGSPEYKESEDFEYYIMEAGDEPVFFLPMYKDCPQKTEQN